jgi:hydroxymethylpyrimidine pyrophosphatase-like HAD family hydrolase
VIEKYETIIVAKGLPSKLIMFTNNTDGLIHDAKIQIPEGLCHIMKGSPDPFYVEFLDSGLSKGICLRKLCDYLGVDMNTVIAFGDGDNDKEMLQMVGHGVAMKNAHTTAKEAADVVLEINLSKL